MSTRLESADNCIIINGVLYPKGVLRACIEGNNLTVWEDLERTIPLVNSVAFGEITHVNTNAPFATIQALNDFVKEHFFFKRIKNISELINDVGYLSSETDPTVPAHVKSITTSDIENWNLVYSDAVYNTGVYSNPAWLSSLAWSKISGTPTSLSGYGITDAYTQAQINNFFSGTSAISGYNKANWDSAYSFTSGFSDAAWIKNQIATIQSADFKISGVGVFDAFNRPITIGNLGTINIKGSTGGWGTGITFKGNADTQYGGFMAYGNEDALIDWRVGDFSNPVVIFNPANKDANFYGNIYAGRATDVEIKALESSTNNYVSLYQQAGTSYLVADKVGGGATQPLAFYTGGSQSMMLEASGILELNKAYLDIKNVGGDRKIQFNRTGGKIFSVEHDASQIYLYNVTDGAVIQRWLNDGYVMFDALDGSGDKLAYLNSSGVLYRSGIDPANISLNTHTHWYLENTNYYTSPDLNRILQAGRVKYIPAILEASDGTVNMFPTSNDANGIMSISTWSNDTYGHELGFSSDGSIYHRSKDFGLYSNWSALLKMDSGRVHVVDSSGGLNNVSDSHKNQTWFDYDYAGTGLVGSAISFSGYILSGNYATELFGEYYSGNDFYLRTRNGDLGTWNSARRIWTNYDFTYSNITNWNAAYGWGNHAGLYVKRNVTINTNFDANVAADEVHSDYNWQNVPNDTIGILQSHNYSPDWIYQEFSALGTGVPNKYLRIRHSGTTWSDWEEFYHTGNLINVSQLDNDAGYLTSSALSGYYKTDFLQGIGTVGGDVNTMLPNGGFATNYSTGYSHAPSGFLYGGMMKFRGSTSDIALDLLFDINHGSSTSGNIAFRTTNSSGLGTWKVIADRDWVLAQGYTTSAGTVTSVNISVPTGFAITGNPITTTGTLALSFASGYSLPTTAKQNNWDTAYAWGDHAGLYYPLSNPTGYISSYINVWDYDSGSNMIKPNNSEGTVQGVDLRTKRLHLEAGSKEPTAGATFYMVQPQDNVITNFRPTDLNVILPDPESEEQQGRQLKFRQLNSTSTIQFFDTNESQYYVYDYFDGTHHHGVEYLSFNIAGGVGEGYEWVEVIAMEVPERGWEWVIIQQGGSLEFSNSRVTL